MTQLPIRRDKNGLSSYQNDMFDIDVTQRSPTFAESVDIADTPIRTGEIIAFGELHQDLLSWILEEDVPEMVTVSQAEELMLRILSLDKLDLDQADLEMLAPLLSGLKTLLR